MILLYWVYTRSTSKARLERETRHIRARSRKTIHIQVDMIQ